MYKPSKEFTIATISHCIMLFILIGVMKFPAISVIICYSIGFILPVILNKIWNFFNYLEKSFRVMR